MGVTIFHLTKFSKTLEPINFRGKICCRGRWQGPLGVLPSLYTFWKKIKIKIPKLDSLWKHSKREKTIVPMPNFQRRIICNCINLYIGTSFPWNCCKVKKNDEKVMFVLHILFKGHLMTNYEKIQFFLHI